MLRHLIEKECKAVLLSPKFALTFAACSVLILLAVGIGAREYHAFAAQQDAARELLAEELREKTGWAGLSTRIFREPEVMQIFATGVHNDVGRLAAVSSRAEARLQQSIYSDDNVLALFRQLDLTFIVQVVLSLFAILFTFDAVNGERELGTLKLIFSNAVPRAHFVVAKLVGTWLALAVPLLLPALLGCLAIVLLRIPLTGDDWAKLGLFALASALYLTFFIALGVGISALTRRSATSFLVSLVTWVVLVLVVPRAALLAAVEIVPVASSAEIESRKSGAESRAWADFRRDLERRWDARNAAMAGLSDKEREAYEDDRLWQWLEEDDASRTAVEREIAEAADRVNEEHRQRRIEQQRVAFGLSRLSPASAYQLVVMSLAGTGVDLKTRYEEAARRYQAAFKAFADKHGSQHMIIGRRHGGGGGTFFGDDANQPLDLTEMPRFQIPRAPLAAVLVGVPLDLGLLGLETLLLVAVGFVGFLRYDLR